MVELKTGVGSRQLDYTYITSRVVVITLPEGVPEALLGPVEDNVRNMLESRHRGQYAVYNLSNRLCSSKLKLAIFIICPH